MGTDVKVALGNGLVDTGDNGTIDITSADLGATDQPEAAILISTYAGAEGDTNLAL